MAERQNRSCYTYGKTPVADEPPDDILLSSP